MRFEYTNDTLLPTLNPAAEYGNLPFDRFVLDHWSHTISPQEDQSQWDSVAKIWLSMDHSTRDPYWAKIWPGPDEAPEAGATYLPTQKQIESVLLPHQTVQERNISQYAASQGHEKILWVRTCYLPSLATSYSDIIEAAGSLHQVDPRWVLDDETLYNRFADDWKSILYRMPELCDDFEGHFCDKSRLHEDELPKDPECLALHRASVEEVQAVYLLDEGALKEELIKLVFLDTHGDVVWEYRLKPEHVEFFEANYYRGGALSRVMERAVDERELLQSGALLDFEGY